MIIENLDFCDEVLNKTYFNTLKKISLPNRKQENYRHINLKEFFKKDLNFNNKISNNDFYKNYSNNDFNIAVFDNSVYMKEVSSLSDDIQIQKNDIQDTKKCSSLCALSRSFIDKKYTINIKENIKKPLLIINIFDGNNSIFSNFLDIKVDENVNAKIVDVFYSPDKQSSFLANTREFDFAKQSKVEYFSINKTSSEDILYFDTNISMLGLKSDAYFFHNSDGFCINECNVFLNNEYSDISLYGGVNIKNKANKANIINIKHNAKHTKSEQIFKHILDDSSRAIFSSIANIGADGQYSSAHQSSASLILSDNARVFNEPKMMIFTDELEASHGAVVGALDEDSINYMLHRGLSRQESENILTKAFEYEVFEYIKDDFLKAFVLKQLNK